MHRFFGGEESRLSLCCIVLVHPCDLFSGASMTCMLGKLCRLVVVFERGIGVADCYGVEPEMVIDLLVN